MLSKKLSSGATFVSSWDDGSKLDMRLAELLKKYSLPGIFYIPTNCELSSDEILQLDANGFEIGCHTDTHPKDLKKLCTTEQRVEILRNKLWLEKLLDKQITNFCYPTGRYNEDTIMVLGQCGITEARTTVQGNTELPIDMYRIQTTVHVYPENARFNKPDWAKTARVLLEKANSENGYFHIWGHSWEIHKFNLWDELEAFFKLIK